MAKVHVTEIKATESGHVVTLSNGDTLELLESVEIETRAANAIGIERSLGTEFVLRGRLVS